MQYTFNLFVLPTPACISYMVIISLPAKEAWENLTISFINFLKTAVLWRGLSPILQEIQIHTWVFLLNVAVYFGDA